VAAYLRGTGRAVTLAPDGELARCDYDRHGTPVVVTLRQFSGVSLALSVPVCPLERVRPRSALVANGELPIGVLAVAEGQIVLRQTLPLASLPAAVLEETLGALSDVAAQLLLVAARVADDPERETPYGYLFR